MVQQWAQLIRGRRAQRTQHDWPRMLPILLRSAISGTVSQGRFRQPWSKRLALFKWVVRGEAFMVVDHQRLRFGPGAVAVYLPTEPHQFWLDQPEAEMCWFSVDGPLLEPFIDQIGLHAGVHPYGPAPTERIDRLIESLDDQTPYGTQRSSVLAIEMLYDLQAKVPPRQLLPVVHQVQHLIQEGLSDPTLSTQQLAARLGYNRGALSRMFHQNTGLTIMDTITQNRLQLAEILLASREYSIGEVARKCGFRDGSYFARWVRKHAGRTPREIRASSPAGLRAG